MTFAVTGASGLVGYPIAQGLAAAGHSVVTLGRAPVAGFPHRPWRFGERPDLTGCRTVVHAAFSHVAGRYRGGEGDDPVGFRAANLTDTLKVFEAAEAAGARVVFLSSRAVYDGYPAGTFLTENLPPRPQTLYGEIKALAEAAMPPGSISLRATGVYGPNVPGRRHKWAELFQAYFAGEPIAPRVSSEVSASDVASAVALVATHPAPPAILNVSDLILDRRDLLERLAKASGIKYPLPAQADRTSLRVMDTSLLQSLGWTPSGTEGLEAVLAELIATETVPK